MPTPIEILLDPIALSLLGLFAAMIAWEALFPARTLPKVRYWPLVGLTSFIFYFFLSTYLPLLWDGSLTRYQVFDVSGLTVFGQFVLALFVFELLLYCWHRALHELTPLWRVFHQMHHSAERLDSFGAFYFSPMDMIGFTFLGSLALVVVIGVNAQAATWVMMFTFFLGVFQHLNIVTPRWLGYVIQRPESHSVHHGQGVHRNNYADLPLFDIVFGTFRNPGKAMDTGFYHGASYRVADMLLFRDVYQPKQSEKQESAPGVIQGSQ